MRERERERERKESRQAAGTSACIYGCDVPQAVHPCKTVPGTYVCVCERERERERKREQAFRLGWVEGKGELNTDM